MMIKKLGLLIGSILLLTGVASAQDVSELTRQERAEIRFLEGMIDHHQMALDMASDCVAKAATESVLTLCQNVITAQSGEIVTMRDWLLAWYNIDYEPVSMYSDHQDDSTSDHTTESTGHDTHGSAPDTSADHTDHAAPFTDPAMMMGMVAGFNRLTGTAYEIAWLESMIDHHDDALHMSERLLPRIVHAELGEFAQTIIDDQSAEIELMEALILDLSAQ